MRAGERATLAVMVAAMLCAGATRAVRCDVRPTTTAAFQTTTPAHIATPAGRAAAPGHGSATPALHTATTARPLHHHLRHIALAHRAARRHVAPEIRARHPALHTAGAPAPAAPPAPARESHPRAALPVLVRPAHHAGWGDGSRLACALPRESGMLAVTATTIPGEEEALVPDTGHEANEARGPPRPGPISIPPAFACSPSFLPRARVVRPTSDSKFQARSALERDRRASGVSRPPHDPARNPLHGPVPGLVVPALPLGRADVRRMESATAYFSGLSNGGVS